MQKNTSHVCVMRSSIPIYYNIIKHIIIIHTHIYTAHIDEELPTQALFILFYYFIIIILLSPCDNKSGYTIDYYDNRRKNN